LLVAIVDTNENDGITSQKKCQFTKKSCLMFEVVIVIRLQLTETKENVNVGKSVPIKPIHNNHYYVYFVHSL
jgi:hypothetical protein